jgi:hypothetical protein
MKLVPETDRWADGTNVMVISNLVLIVDFERGCSDLMLQ